MVNQQRLVDRFKRLIEVDSPSKEEYNLRQQLQQELQQLGLDTFVDNAGTSFGGNSGNLMAKLKGNLNNVKPIMFSSHMDTVVSNRGVKLINEDATLKTDGSTILGADDKAGICILLEALTILKEEKVSHGDLEFVFTVGEELGLLGSRNLDLQAIKSKIGFVLDSGEDVGVIINQAPSQEDFTIEFIGREAHSGVNPEQGINAIEMVGKFLIWFPYGKIDEETTGNIGLIKGGEAVNIVPAKVQLIGEIRSHNDIQVSRWIKQIEVKAQEIAESFKGHYTFKSERMYSSFYLREEDETVALALKALEAIGRKGILKKRGGGSDANNFNNHGVQVVNLAIGLTKGHTNEESIKIENLTKGTELVVALIKEAAKNN